MKLSNVVIPIALGVALSTILLGGSAAAHQAPGGATRGDDRLSNSPNRKLLRSGVWTLGMSYVPAFVVAVASPRAADKNLFIPVGGPWIDYATRDCRECTHETLNRVLLVTDGIFQGVGALQIVGSFLFWETRGSPTANAKSERATGASLQIVPRGFGAGAYGMAARGRF